MTKKTLHSRAKFCLQVVMTKNDRNSVAQSWTALFRAFSFHQQPSACMNQKYSQPPLGQSGQTLMICAAAVEVAMTSSESNMKDIKLFQSKLSYFNDRKIIFNFKHWRENSEVNIKPRAEIRLSRGIPQS